MDVLCSSGFRKILNNNHNLIKRKFSKIRENRNEYYNNVLKTHCPMEYDFINTEEEADIKQKITSYNFKSCKTSRTQWKFSGESIMNEA